MSGFTDRIQQADGITVTLNCGKCGQPADAPHTCVRRMMRSPRIVLVQPVADNPDLFIVKVEKSDEQYTTSRAALEADYTDTF